MKLYKRNEILKINDIMDFKIDLTIFNKNNKIYKKKILPLKVLANLNSSSRQ